MDYSGQAVAYLSAHLYRTDVRKTLDFKDHPRPFSSVACLLSGQGTFRSDGRCGIIRAGDLFFTPRGSCYQLELSPDAAYYSCHFVFPYRSSPLAGNGFRVQRAEGSEAVRDALAFIVEHQDEPERMMGILARFYAVCDALLPQLETRPLPQMDPRIAEAVGVIETTYMNRDSLARLAGQALMSSSHFHACFKKVTGCSPVEYRNRVAVRHAEQLLLDEHGLSIEEISTRTGFESAASFRRVFRSVTGKSPREYRKDGNW